MEVIQRGTKLHTFIPWLSLADRNMRSAALSDLISNLIGRVVTVETITANEPPIEFKNDRRMRFDISCLAKTGELLSAEKKRHGSGKKRQWLKEWKKGWPKV